VSVRTGPALVRRPEDLTVGWLTEVLAGSNVLGSEESIDSFTVEPVGTGQMGDTVRVGWRPDPALTQPRSVIAKFASADEQSRSTGRMTRAYEIEVGFYGEMAHRVRTRMPRCYHGQCDPETGWFVLLLEDLVDAVPGDQLAGCGVEAAAAALDELAGLHAPVWGQADLALVEWLRPGGAEADAFLTELVTSLWPGFVDRYRDRLDRDHLALCDRFIGVLGPWLTARPPATTVTHGDFRLDNLLFLSGEARPYVVDWQTAAWGRAASDLAYFIGGCLSVDDRRRHQEVLVDGYYAALEAAGITGFGRDRLDREYRTLCFGGLVMAIGASMLVKRTERGDEMFVTSVARFAQQALDFDAEATLPVRRGR